MVKYSTSLSIVFVVGLGLSVPVAAQDLQQVKDLYASAAYEDALGVLSRLERPEQRLEIERYRVFCLIALDRSAEAEKAILTMLTEDPLYTPDEASPRVVDLFDRVKKQATPQLAKALYAEGKAAMDRKERDVAIRKFEQMLQLTDDKGIRDETMVSELRLLAAGFLDLARAKGVADTAKVTAPANAAPGNAAAQAPSGASTAAAVMSPPIPIRQELPRWIPYDATSKAMEYKGAIKVMIAADGRVESAEIVTPTDRLYDRQLLNAARSWLYEPAKRNGVAVSSEKVVSVFLRPR
jgi:TonB family protein